jgi:hypothetical protein
MAAVDPNSHEHRSPSHGSEEDGKVVHAKGGDQEQGICVPNLPPHLMNIDVQATEHEINDGRGQGERYERSRLQKSMTERFLRRILFLTRCNPVGQFRYCCHHSSTG